MLNYGDKVRIHGIDRKKASMYTPYWARGETATVIRAEQDAVYVKIDRYAICYAYCDPCDLKPIKGSAEQSRVDPCATCSEREKSRWGACNNGLGICSAKLEKERRP